MPANDTSDSSQCTSVVAAAGDACEGSAQLEPGSPCCDGLLGLGLECLVQYNAFVANNETTATEL